MIRRWRELGDQAGQAVVIVALGFTGLLAAAGIAGDAGVMFVERRRGQVAADAAAFAAAAELAKNWSAPNRSDLARTAALAYAARNGYSNDGVTNTVTVSIPPVSGGYVGNADYAEVNIGVNVRTNFVRVLGPAYEVQAVNGRAVGGITPPSKPYSVIALAKTGNATLDLNGQVQLRADEAGILVNSNGTPAFTANGNAEVRADPVGVDVVGTAQVTGGADVRGPLTTGAAQIADPLAYLVPPTGAGMTLFPPVTLTGGNLVIDPGIYPSIDVSGDGRVQMRPGVYIIKGGGIRVTGAGRLEDEVIGDANGVFIYNACAAFPLPTGICGAIRTAGNGRIDLDKDTTAPYAGMSIWQPCENTQEMSITGASSGTSSHKFEVSGTVYLPCATVRAFGGGPDQGMLRIRDGQLVANQIAMGGKAQIHVDWDSSAGTTTRIPAIVE